MTDVAIPKRGMQLLLLYVRWNKNATLKFPQVTPESITIKENNQAIIKKKNRRVGQTNKNLSFRSAVVDGLSVGTLKRSEEPGLSKQK